MKQKHKEFWNIFSEKTFYIFKFFYLRLLDTKREEKQALIVTVIKNCINAAQYNSFLSLAFTFPPKLVPIKCFFSYINGKKNK